MKVISARTGHNSFFSVPCNWSIFICFRSDLGFLFFQANSRSWNTFHTVLMRQTLCFYQDKKDTLKVMAVKEREKQQHKMECLIDYMPSSLFLLLAITLIDFLHEKWNRCNIKKVSAKYLTVSLFFF